MKPSSYGGGGLDPIGMCLMLCAELCPPRGQSRKPVRANSLLFFHRNTHSFYTSGRQQTRAGLLLSYSNTQPAFTHNTILCSTEECEVDQYYYYYYYYVEWICYGNSMVALNELNQTFKLPFNVLTGRQIKPLLLYIQPVTICQFVCQLNSLRAGESEHYNLRPTGKPPLVPGGKHLRLLDDAQ